MLYMHGPERAQMTRKSCAAGMRNAILRNNLSEVASHRWNNSLSLQAVYFILIFRPIDELRSIIDQENS